MTELIDELVLEGRQVRLLTGDMGDLEAVYDLQKRIRAPNLRNVIFEPVASLKNLMEQIAKRISWLPADIITSFALSMGRPSISVGYARKNDALLNDTGLGEFCHHIESFNPQTLLTQIDSMFSRREELVKAVKAGVEIYRERLAKQEEVLRVHLLQKIS